MSPLTTIFCLPLLAALLIVAIPRNYKFVIRSLALLATLSSLVVAIIMFCQFNGAAVVDGFRFTQQIEWVKSLGISYHVGVDGINVGLILMGAAVAFAATCVSNKI